MLSAGTRLGIYEIRSHIGAGGMGEVYRARDTRLDREVAIKVLRADLAADHALLSRFAREAKVLASLNHSNIAQIYGIEDSGNTPALVMELVPGETLEFAAPKTKADALDRPDVRLADCGSTPRRTRSRHCSPRSQAGEHYDHARGPGQSP